MTAEEDLKKNSKIKYSALLGKYIQWIPLSDALKAVEQARKEGKEEGRFEGMLKYEKATSVVGVKKFKIFREELKQVRADEREKRSKEIFEELDDFVYSVLHDWYAPNDRLAEWYHNELVTKTKTQKEMMKDNDRTRFKYEGIKQRFLLGAKEK